MSHDMITKLVCPPPPPNTSTQAGCCVCGSGVARGCHARRPAAPPPPAPPRPQRTIPAHVAPCASHAPSPGLFFVPARPPQFPCPFWQPPCCSFSLSLPLASAPPPPKPLTPLTHATHTTLRLVGPPDRFMPPPMVRTNAIHPSVSCAGAPPPMLAVPRRHAPSSLPVPPPPPPLPAPCGEAFNPSFPPAPPPLHPSQPLLPAAARAARPLHQHLHTVQTTTTTTLHAHPPRVLHATCGDRPCGGRAQPFQ